MFKGKKVVSNIDMSKLKGTMTKWPVQKQTHRTAQKHAENQDAADIQNTLFLCFSEFFIFIYD